MRIECIYAGLYFLCDNMRSFFLFAVLLPGIVACQSRKNFDHSVFEMGVSNGLMNNPLLTEVSGLASSIANPGMFWVNNDSGDEPRIYLIDSAANLIAIVRLEGAENRDWEEVAIGKGPDPNLNYVYVGEIGDNLAQYPTKHIYRIADFKVQRSNKVLDTLITAVDHLEVKLPDGQRDSEAFVVDPVSNNIFLFSKREKEINLYEIDSWARGDHFTEAKFLLKLPFTQITAADISPDGSELLIKNYENVYYWTRDISKPFISIFDRSARVLPYIQEPQGESIAFDIYGKGYFTTSEYANGKIPHLIFYKRTEITQD